MGRKYDTRGSTGAAQSDTDGSASGGADRRVPVDDRERVQQRLSSAIEAVRAEAARTEEGADGDEESSPGANDRAGSQLPEEAHPEHQETLDRMAGMLDAQRGHARSEADERSLEGEPMVPLPGDSDEGDEEDAARELEEFGEWLRVEDDDGDESKSDTGLFGVSSPFGESSDSDTDTVSGTSAESSRAIEEDGDGDTTENGGADDEPVLGPYSHLGRSEASSPEELAHEYLTEQAVAERYRGDTGGSESGIGQRAIPVEESSPNRIGGWDEYDPENADEVVPLSDTGVGGRTADHMDKVELADGADGTDTAFVTYYTSEGRETRHNAPPKRCAESQMGMYAFCDAVGVSIPRHTYNKNEEWVAAYGIDGQAADDLRFSDNGTEVARSVDREEFKDQMAVQILGGNRDLHGQNVHIDDDGGVHCIDLDLGGQRTSQLDHAAMNAVKVERTSERIADAREESFDEQDEDFAVPAHEVTERAQEIAVAIHNSGDTDRIVGAVEQYDEQFPDVRKNLHENIRENIEMFVRAARNGRRPEPLNDD